MLTYTQLTTQFGSVDAAADARAFISFLDVATASLTEIKELGFAMLRLATGERVLDVGCGTGDDARRMAHFVGRDGYVLGLDSSRSMASEALGRGPRRQSPVEFAVGDVQHLPVDDSTFDVCRAERVLQHVDAPRRALSEMARVVKPGGRVMVIDADHGMDAINASDRATTCSIVGIFQENLRNPWIGRQLPGLFRACGLREVESRIVPISFTDYRVASALVDFEGLARQAAEDGVVTAAGASRWLRDLEARARTGDFLLVMMGFLVVGHK
jgi:SAM-dependent methyltransferase